MRTLLGSLLSLFLATNAFALKGVHLPADAQLGAKLTDDQPAQISITLKVANPAAVKQLIADQQDPSSPEFHRFLTVQEYADRFGPSISDYESVARWAEASGLTVTRFPNRTYLTASGKVSHIKKLLSIEPHFVTQWGKQFRTAVGDPVIPAEIEKRIEAIHGLDTRANWKHHLKTTRIADSTSQNGFAFGAADFRNFYNFSSYFTSGATSGTMETAVIATQAEANDPPTASLINEYISDVSKGGVTYNPITLSNTNGSYDGSTDGNLEYELDAEMQSVGAANLSKVDMVLAPSDTVFTDGPNWIVNMLPNVVAASTSLGQCEPNAFGSNGAFGGTSTSFDALFDQGLAQGITWFAAAGDEGAYDCEQGSQVATVDWPCSLPEFVCMGGTQLSTNSGWNSSDVMESYTAETTWNESETLPSQDQGGAGGGGVSTYYAKPSWQTQSGSFREVPDLALEAATYTPGVALYDDGTSGLDVVGGTSVASPLGAGIFALIASQKGCTHGLGDIHATLYSLGAAQKSGGTAVFHDITTGNNSLGGVTGFDAATGYDEATGWGSLDVEALVGAWPGCPSGSSTTTTTGTVASSSSGTTGTAASTGSTGTTGSTNTCETCADSAQTGACSTEATACENDTNCTTLANCLGSCTTSACETTCETASGQTAVTELENYDNCVCNTACTTQCASECGTSSSSTGGTSGTGGTTGSTGGAGFCAACTSAADCASGCCDDSTGMTCSSTNGFCDDMAACASDSDCGGNPCDTSTGVCCNSQATSGTTSGSGGSTGTTGSTANECQDCTASDACTNTNAQCYTFQPDGGGEDYCLITCTTNTDCPSNAPCSQGSCFPTSNTCVGYTAPATTTTGTGTTGTSAGVGATSVGIGATSVGIGATSVAASVGAASGSTGTSVGTGVGSVAAATVASATAASVGAAGSTTGGNAGSTTAGAGAAGGIGAGAGTAGGPSGGFGGAIVGASSGSNGSVAAVGSVGSGSTGGSGAHLNPTFNSSSTGTTGGTSSGGCSSAGLADLTPAIFALLGLGLRRRRT